MRVVKLIEILVDYVLLLAFAAALVGGVFLWPLFIAAALCLGLHFLWAYLRLRCPWCGSILEPGALLRGLRRSCHCPACGHEILVVTHVTRSVPEHPPRDLPAPPRDENVTKPVSGVK